MGSRSQDCDCGFIDSHDPTKSTFNSLLTVNFSSITRQQFDDLFIPATYELTPRNSPYTRNFSASQVQLSDTGLGLTVSPSPDKKRVPCAQIFTRAASFFYGSYHAQFRVGAVPGTVTAFFNYKNDSSEVDLEYLSAWKDPALLYTVKPQIYLDNGNPSNTTFQEEAWNSTSTSFDQKFHEWSFVWLPDIVHFGLDAKYPRHLTTNVPRAPGRLALNHWSDGNRNYSLGPPTKDSTVTVSFLWAVYNNTDANALVCKKATSPCRVTNGIVQGRTASNGGGGSGSSVVSVGSAHSINPAASGWLLALLFISWFRCLRHL
jgi:beta-glucanase (GH16 family)